MPHQRWTHARTCVFNLGYHIIWCPKYRRGVLVGQVETRLKALLRQKADEIDVAIEILEVTPDHVHIFVKTKPTNAPHYVVQQLKGFTSNILRSEFPHLLKMPSLWTRSYYCESVGHISEQSIRRYIEEQKNK